jgi:hypothetical protein
MLRRLSTRLGDVLSIVDDTPLVSRLSTIFWNFEEPSFEEETGVSRSWLSSQSALLERSQQVLLLPDVQTPSADIYALYPSIDRTPRRITAAIEHLQQSLGARIGF